MTLATSKKAVTLLAEVKNNHQTYAAKIAYFEQGRDERSRLEGFINQVFKRYYNTKIEQFYPCLLSIESPNHQVSGQVSLIKAVAVVRCAAEETLFSEHYLDNPLKTELYQLYGKIISREYIVEIGNLAPANIGQMRWLIASITAFLQAAGFKYIIFTGVSGVYNAFQRMDIPLKFITKAKQNRLPLTLKNQWGDEYYQLQPKVMAGDIAQGFEIIKTNIYQSNKKLIPLFEQAYQLGTQFRTGVLTGEVA
jgi:hypothetical protein